MSDHLPVKPGNSIFIVFGGILLPIAALGFELWTRVLRGLYLDPMPTPLHCLLIASVPIANLLLLRALRKGVLPGRATLLLHAFATGVSAIYTILFLPTLPVAPFAILLFGLGLLLLSPVFSLIAAVMARRWLVRASGRAATPFWASLLVAGAVMVALDAPAVLTRVGLQMATSATPQTRMQGVRWLRLAGSDEVLLHFCHPRTRIPGGIVGALLALRSHITMQEARSVFFQVTGESYSSRPVPPSRGIFDRDALFDFDLGGEKVGQQAGGVHLASSRIDGSVDALSALGYLEWTMTLRNDSDQQQEGRAELLLPTGAVVSRATLWINGEEHEAVFGGRGQVRAAYQTVVRARRDPLLVTTAGNGRVLIQMFPIQPKGTMKIRIGMTTPLQLPTLQRASMLLPVIAERNFEIDSGLHHAVWIESAAPLSAAGSLRAERVKPALFAVRGEVANLVPGAVLPSIDAQRPQPNLVAWSRDDKGETDDIIVQTISEQTSPAPARIALVIDGSSSMRQLIPQLRAALEQLPASAAVQLVFAGDGLPTVFEHRHADLAATLAFLDKRSFEGGRDNGAALARAWEWTSGDDNGAIVWIHGPQPEESGDADVLVQAIARRPWHGTFYDMQAAPGPNVLASRIDGASVPWTVRTSAYTPDGLASFLGSLRPDAKRLSVQREREPVRAMSNEALTSGHLARLWAAQQIGILASIPERQGEAIAMATNYQLVTPVSGAVVLESEAANTAAGLQGVEPGSVPTIPEPETWAMLMVALLILAARRLRQRRA